MSEDPVGKAGETGSHSADRIDDAREEIGAESTTGIERIWRSRKVTTGVGKCSSPITDFLDRHQQVLRDADISRTSETAHCPLTSAVA